MGIFPEKTNEKVENGVPFARECTVTLLWSNMKLKAVRKLNKPLLTQRESKSSNLRLHRFIDPRNWNVFEITNEIG